jgi:predicted aspartyl protease
MSCRCLSIIALLLSVTFQPSIVLAADACEQAAVSIGLTYDDRGRPLVPVIVDGHDGIMQLDTGGAITAVEMDFVMDLGLPQTYAGFTMTAVTGESSWLMTTAPSFSLDAITRPDLDLMILPGYDYQLSDDEPVGLLALDILSEYSLHFDFENDHFEAFEPDGCVSERESSNETEPVDLPLLDRGGNYLTVLIQLDGLALNAIIDTGAANSVVNGDIAGERFGLDLRNPDERMTEVDNVAGIPIYARRFSTLVIGGLEISDPQLTMFPDFVRETGLASPEGGQVSLPQAIIGMDILRGRHLYVGPGRSSLQISESSIN